MSLYAEHDTCCLIIDTALEDIDMTLGLFINARINATWTHIEMFL